MALRFLLTSFTTWKSHQKTNSSDDLLHQVSQCHPRPGSLLLLRKLPVKSPEAIAQTLSYLHQYQPPWVICCGMAENRDRISIESNATQGDRVLQPAIDLEHLIADLDRVYISHNAGKFVCEDLYYGVLEAIQTLNLNSRSLFVHIPAIDRQNEMAIVNTFLQLLHRLETL